MLLKVTDECYRPDTYAEGEVFAKVGSSALVVWCVRYLNCHHLTFNLPGHECQIRPKLRVPTNTYSLTLKTVSDVSHFQSVTLCQITRENGSFISEARLNNANRWVFYPGYLKCTTTYSAAPNVFSFHSTQHHKSHSKFCLQCKCS